MNPTQFVDIFGPAQQDGNPNKGTVQFGSEYSEETDIMNPASTTETTTLSSTTETTTEAVEGSTTDTTTLPENGNVDILNQPQKGRKPKYGFEDISGYFADRIKSGKFVAVEEEDQEGNVVQFVPKTPEEFDEVIDIQVNYKLDQERKGLEQKWYQSKSPAWQAVAKFANMVDNPAEIIPFLQGVQTISSVANIDENDLSGAEQIVRIRMEQRGEAKDVIDEQIEALKTTDKLVSTAQKYKPSILKEEQLNLQRLAQKEEKEQRDYEIMVSNIQENVIKSIETPLFGKTKIKQEEKASIYELIGEPSQESKGYEIYSEIDKLFDSRDFDTLKMVALLLKHKDSFFNYIKTSAAVETAQGLQKRIRAAGTISGSGGKDMELDDEREVISRNQYSTKTRFGR